MKNLRITYFFLLCMLSALPFCAQESAMEQFMAEHHMGMLTADSIDPNHDDLVITALAMQQLTMTSPSPSSAQPHPDSSAQPAPQPCILQIDTVSGHAELLSINGQHLADVHFTLVDSTWYMWLSVDPLADKYIHQSPYLYCGGNPIMLIDPDGQGSFYVGRKEIGDDGKEDGRTYVLKTSKHSFGEGDAIVAGAGLTGKQRRYVIDFVKQNTGKEESFLNNPEIYGNFVELDSKDVRQAMYDFISQYDNGFGGITPNNNREYGGTIEDGHLGKTVIGNVFSPGAPGDITLPSNQKTFHSHASGDTRIGNKWFFSQQSPSPTDIAAAGQFMHYVFGMSKRGPNYPGQMVFLYDAHGVQACLPIVIFLKIGY